MNQPQPDRHAQFITDLRALADMFQQHPELPIPHAMDGTAYIHHAAPQVKVAAVFQLAQLLGTPVTYDQERGVCETSLTSGRVTYRVYASIPKPLRTGGPATVYEPSEVLRAIGVSTSPSQVLSAAKTALGEA